MPSSCDTCGRPLGILTRLQGGLECGRCRDEEILQVKRYLAYSRASLPNWSAAGLPDRVSDAEARQFIGFRRRVSRAMGVNPSGMSAAAAALMPNPIPCAAYLEGRQAIDCSTTMTFLQSSVNAASLVLPWLMGDRGDACLVVWWRLYCAGLRNFGGPTPIVGFADSDLPTERVVADLALLKTAAYADYFRPQDVQPTPWTEPGYIAYADCSNCQFSRLPSAE